MCGDLECAAPFPSDVWLRKWLMKVIIYSKHKTSASLELNSCHQHFDESL